MIPPDRHADAQARQAPHWDFAPARPGFGARRAVSPSEVSTRTPPNLTPRLSARGPNPNRIAKPPLLEAAKPLKHAVAWAGSKPLSPVDCDEEGCEPSWCPAPPAEHDVKLQIDAVEQRLIAACEVLAGRVLDRLGACAEQWGDCRALLEDIAARQAEMEGVVQAANACASIAAQLGEVAGDLRREQRPASPGKRTPTPRSPCHRPSWGPQMPSTPATSVALVQAEPLPVSDNEEQEAHSSSSEDQGEGAPRRRRRGRHAPPSGDEAPVEGRRKSRGRSEVWDGAGLMDADVMDSAETMEGKGSMDSSEKTPSAGTRRSQRLQRAASASVQQILGDAAPESRLHRISQSTWFNCLGIAMTLANCLLIAVDADISIGDAFARATGGAQADSEVWRETFDIMQKAFVAFLVFEVLVHFFALRASFFLGPAWHWNLFDLFIMSISVFAVTTMQLDTSASYVRVVRIFRLTRILWAVRFVRYSEPLQRMLGAVTSVAITLFWMAVLLFIVMYVFGVAVMESVTVFVDHAQPPVEPADVDGGGLLQDLQTFYGGVWRTWLTLFRVLTGSDWTVFAAPLVAIGAPWGVAWFVYVFCTFFGLVNIVTGLVVDIVKRPLPLDKTIAIAAEAKEEMTLTELFAGELKRLGHGEHAKMTRRVFNRFVETTAVSKQLRISGIDLQRLGDAFDLIDVEKAGSVTPEAIAKHFLTMREDAKGYDIRRLAMDIGFLHTAISGLATSVSAARDGITALATSDVGAPRKVEPVEPLAPKRSMR